MLKYKKKIFLLLSLLIFILIISLVFIKIDKSSNQWISTKLVTSVHKDLPLEFESEEKNISKQIFAFSILYLFAIFISILVDKFA